MKKYVVYADVYRNGKLLFEHTTIVNEVINADEPAEALGEAVDSLVALRDFDYSYEDKYAPKGTTICLDYQENGRQIIEKYDNFVVEEVDDDFTFKNPS